MTLLVHLLNVHVAIYIVHDDLREVFNPIHVIILP